MESVVSENFKKIFLLTFTKELIKNAGKRDIAKLQNIVELKEKRKEKKPQIFIPQKIPRKLVVEPPVFLRKEIPRQIEFPKKEIQIKGMEITPEKIKPLTRPLMRRPIPQKIKPILAIPEPKLPKHLEYLKPLPKANAEVEIDLGKLNPLLKDRGVKIIEGSPDEKVRIMGTMGTRMTDIFLTKEDVDRVISKFSEISKIPTNEGVYRVVVGNLILSAIISEVVGSRFVIKKMAYQQNQNQNQQLIPKKPFY